VVRQPRPQAQFYGPAQGGGPRAFRSRPRAAAS
jgi:hypothetical protein